ncbi:MAG: cell division protein FtsA [Endomicrobium sp.]|jgi:cell division protein FtsA|nr:cell division protein FtsA [Endomicrobium sp.]
MAKRSLVAGLDVGSNKICCAAGMYDGEAKLIKIFGAVSVPCDGIRAGAVIDIQEAAISIGEVFEKIEKATESYIENVVVALRGNFIKSKSSRGFANTNTNHSETEITRETVQSALESARKQIKMDSDEEILQIAPREYILNQQKGIQNPIGMDGTYIEVDVYAFIASRSNMGNIAKAMISVGINFNDKVYGYLAASNILVTKEEKELSCLVIDLGGLTTGLVHFADGIVKHIDEISDGSDYITRDISHKLKSSYSISKEIKEMYGAAFVHKDFKSEEFEYKGADGRTTKKYDRLELVNGVITPRIDRILYEIKEIVERNGYGHEFLSGGIILTGGGSNLPGLVEAFEKTFDCSVRTGVPDSNKIVCPNEVLLNPSYATAIGSVAYGFLNLKDYSRDGKKSSKNNNIFSKISKWFEEVF